MIKWILKKGFQFVIRFNFSLQQYKVTRNRNFCLWATQRVYKMPDLLAANPNSIPSITWSLSTTDWGPGGPANCQCGPGNSQHRHYGSNSTHSWALALNLQVWVVNSHWELQGAVPGLLNITWKTTWCHTPKK